jgi:thiamine phosphate synthase YjbQ (UPF0047 family)
MLYKYRLATTREDFYDITAQVRDAISQSGITDGTAVAYLPAYDRRYYN